MFHLVDTWSFFKLSSIKFSVYALRNSENEMAFFRKHFIVFSSIQDTVTKFYTAKEQKKKFHLEEWADMYVYQKSASGYINHVALWLTTERARDFSDQDEEKIT